MIVILNILVLGSSGLGAWWLSGYDAKVTGEDQTRDTVRRGIRCGLTVILMEIAFRSLMRWWLYGEQTSGYIYLAIALPLAITWAGCLSELFARGFQNLLDPKDERAIDLKETQRALDTIASLVREGRTEEAIRMCRERLSEGDVSVLAMEALLEQLEAPSSPSGGPPVLPAAGAEATEPQPAMAASSAPVIGVRGKSIEQLLEEGYRGTAIEILEQQLKEKPGDFALWLKLAEAYGRHCGNFKRAEKIIDQLAANPAFLPEQVQSAKAQLKLWRKSCSN